MEVHQLRYFVAVAENGSFSRAAERMHVAQPSLSQQIQKLEGELGQPLFDRLPRRITLTEAGQALLPYARKVLMDLGEARRCLQDHAKEPTGEVRVGIIPTIGPFLVEPLLRHIGSTHSGIKTTIVEGVTDDLARWIDTGELDLAILSDCHTASGMHIETCASEPLMLALPQLHSLASRASVGARHLRGETILTLHESNCLSVQVKRWCVRHRIKVLSELPIVQLSTLFALVASNQGVSLVPSMARPSAVNPGCVVLPFAAQAPTRKINLLRNTSRYQTKAATAAAESARLTIRALVSTSA